MEKNNSIELALKQQFEDLFRENLHKIQFIAKHYLKDTDLSKNVAQDVFSTLWEKRHDVDFSRPMLPYLSVLTKNRCLNILKNQKIVQRFRDSNSDDTNQLKIDLINSTTEEKIFSGELESIMFDSMEKMSESIRTAFILSRFENKKYKEIADIQKVSIKTIEYRIMSALKVLRRGMKDYIRFF